MQNLNDSLGAIPYEIRHKWRGGPFPFPFFFANSTPKKFGLNVTLHFLD